MSNIADERRRLHELDARIKKKTNLKLRKLETFSLDVVKIILKKNCNLY